MNLQEDPKFGTDGVRGVANADLSPHFAFRLGRVSAAVLRKYGGADPLLLGRDTRLSGDMLGCALAAGFLSTGAGYFDLGVVPTPGVAFLTRRHRALAGGMISASHNPAPDNGIKFFGPDGRKIRDEIETEIEASIDDWEKFESPTGAEIGRLMPGEALVEEYAAFLIESCSGSLRGLKVVLDCGNGAAHRLAPRVAAGLGASIEVLNAAPDGMNINLGCGALHPEGCAEAVRRCGADLGVAFDGDADRAIFLDERGELVDGDRVMAMCALAWKGTERLPNDTVVGTVMSNLGLEAGLQQAGIRLLRADVGDRNVADMMSISGAALGGEKSGHIIFGDRHTTGDGIFTFIQVADLMQRTGRKLSDLAAQIQEYPQLLVNVPVWRRRGWRVQPELWQAVRRAEEQLGGGGRILVRASGTERIIRVMAEAEDEDLVHRVVADVAGVIRETMGDPPAAADEVTAGVG